MNLEYGAANDRLSCVAELVKSFVRFRLLESLDDRYEIGCLKYAKSRLASGASSVGEAQNKSPLNGGL